MRIRRSLVLAPSTPVLPVRALGPRSPRRVPVLSAVAVLVLLAPAVPAVPAAAQSQPAVPAAARSTQEPGTVRVSVSSGGEQGNAYSYDPSVDDTGRYVAFTSAATNLVAGDTNGLEDVFVHDRDTGTTERVDVSDDGVESDEGGSEPAISGDGRYVAFTSWSSHLVPGDTNGRADVFVRDRATGSTTRVSLTSQGAEADGPSGQPAISGDGRYVAFLSEARNLVGMDANGRSPDVLLHDRRLGTTVLASVSLSGAGGDGYTRDVSVSDNGRYVAFYSFSTDLIAGDDSEEPGIFVRDLRVGVTTRASLTDAGDFAVDVDFGAISGNGRYVVFGTYDPVMVSGDTNGVNGFFIHDRWTGRNQRVTLATSGEQANDSSLYPSISDDGRYVAFQSFATNLVPDDGSGLEDVFVHDARQATTRRVSVDAGGGDADSYSDGAAISGDGRSVAFVSYASDLVPGDTNGCTDVFVRG